MSQATTQEDWNNEVASWQPTQRCDNPQVCATAGGVCGDTSAPPKLQRSLASVGNKPISASTVAGKRKEPDIQADGRTEDERSSEAFEYILDMTHQLQDDINSALADMDTREQTACMKLKKIIDAFNALGDRA